MGASAAPPGNDTSGTCTLNVDNLGPFPLLLERKEASLRKECLLMAQGSRALARKEHAHDPKTYATRPRACSMASSASTTAALAAS